MAQEYTDILSSWVSGDSYEFTKSVADYPSTDGWTLKYHFRALEVSTNKAFYTGTLADRTVKALDVTATTSGNGYLVTITAAESATLFPGRWSYSARLTKDSEAKTIATGFVDIKPNLADQTADTYDSRTEAEYNLELCNAALKALATSKMGSHSVAGRTFTYQTIGELRKLKAHWAGIVAREKGTGPQIMLARFRGVA